MSRIGVFASARVAAGASGLLNHVAIAAPRNGTTTHTVGPSSGTVVAGTAFTPTAGNLLLCVANGAVTSTTPSGWALPSGGSAINNSGLYLWYRNAAGGGDSFTTTHNASNYPVLFEFFEYAAGATFLGSAAATNVAIGGGAGPSLGSLTGTYDAYGTVGYAQSTSNSNAVTWAAGTELVDTNVAISGTDGYMFSTTQVLGRTGASWSVAATGSGTFNGTFERLSWAVRP